MLPENTIYIGVLINLFFCILYARSIIYSSTRPNLVSWFVWTLAPFVGVFLQLKAGAGLSVLGTFMSGFGPLLVIIVCLFKKNAFWKITKFDMICGFLALFALMLYVVTNKLGISILFAILSDGLAGVPTIIKSWKFPETETGSVYIGGIINNALALLIIKNWSFSIYSFSIYFIIMNSIIFFAIYRKKFFKIFESKKHS